MTDAEVRAHIRSALELAAKREEERVRESMGEYDKQWQEQIVSMRPVVEALSALREELEPRADIRFSFAVDGHSATVNVGTGGDGNRVHVTFDNYDLARQYRLEFSANWSLADGGLVNSVENVKKAEDAVALVIEMVGKYIGAKRATE